MLRAFQHCDSSWTLTWKEVCCSIILLSDTLVFLQNYDYSDDVHSILLYKNVLGKVKRVLYKFRAFESHQTVRNFSRVSCLSENHSSHVLYSTQYICRYVFSQYTFVCTCYYIQSSSAWKNNVHVRTTLWDGGGFSAWITYCISPGALDSKRASSSSIVNASSDERSQLMTVFLILNAYAYFQKEKNLPLY